ncbi:MAG: MATE family efflux transporter [Methanosphaera sp.]|uniref:MATE family efflux transporter n=1 Tax=Methanosphaera sp. TaxID=2666342 RepID=UPI0025CC9D28|nr:MATE family efflux transporter [Methanosphaera sp.]MCI5867195.1 MATE family efflux transporter [Methanosphaera sp.]MDD6534737.1 MATE family efflux transporter [Methanosphaera sp.]MDY3955595.1 MATE family efflux transporter [Methanosphaera sp.]
MAETNDNIDLIMGDHKTAIKKLAWPIIFSMLFVTLYNIADEIWVAGLGMEELAAIGFVAPLLMIAMSLGSGTEIAVNSLIARFIGSNNYKQANNTALHGMIITLIISIICGISLCLALPTILMWMNAGSATQAALNYSYIQFGCLFITLYNNIAIAILRAEGNAKRVMYAMMATSILNMILDPIFIYYLHMGISGAAYATVLSTLISCLILFYWIQYKKDIYLDLSLSNFKFNKAIVLDLFNIAIPYTIECIMLSSLSIIGNWLFVTAGGVNGVATYAAVLRLIEVVDLPISGIGFALITVAGAAYGSKDFKKLKQSFGYGLKLTLTITTILVVIFLVFAPQLCTAFTNQQTASMIPHIALALRIMVLKFYGVCFGTLSVMFFQGIGKGITAFVIKMFRCTVCEYIFAILFAVTLGLGEFGIYGGIVIGGFIGGIVALVYAKYYINKIMKQSHEDIDIKTTPV